MIGQNKLIATVFKKRFLNFLYQNWIVAIDEIQEKTKGLTSHTVFVKRLVKNIEIVDLIEFLQDLLLILLFLTIGRLNNKIQAK